MWKITKTIILFTLVCGLGIFYMSKYTYNKIPSGDLLYLNPFQADKAYFDKNYMIAIAQLSKGDTLSSIVYFTNALKYRSTYNEKQYQNTYSDSKNYWSDEIEMLLKYSQGYEIVGRLDSASSCLSTGLIMRQKHRHSIDKRFYQLFLLKQSKAEILKKILSGLDNIKSLDCYGCSDFYYNFDNFKIGIDKSELDTLIANKSELKRKLIDKYRL